MTEVTRDLLNRALTLPPAERVKLAQELLVSVEGGAPERDDDFELDPEFVARLRQDAEDFLSGKSGPVIPAGEAFVRARRTARAWPRCEWLPAESLTTNTARGDPATVMPSSDSRAGGTWGLACKSPCGGRQAPRGIWGRQPPKVSAGQRSAD